MRPICYVLLGFWYGCAHTAPVANQPATEPDFSGLQRVAVMEFSGHRGEAVATALANRLRHRPFYTMVDPVELTPDVQPATFQSTHDHSGRDLPVPAKSAGVDGIVLGQVLEYRCEDLPVPERKFPVRPPSSFRRWFNRRGDATDERRMRQATVSLEVSLIDAGTGQVRVNRRISREFEEEVPFDDAPSSEELLERLAEECLDEAARMLAPNEDHEYRQLSRCDLWTRGRNDVRQGIRLARQGDWLRAERKWRQAVETNPENHAALFNLAVSAARSGDHCVAEDFAMRALRIQHREQYALGLEQIRRQRVACDALQQERASQSLTTADALWE